MPFAERSLPMLLAAAMLFAPLQPAAAQEAEPASAEAPAEAPGKAPDRAWLWSITPYFWATDINETVTLDDRVVSGGQTEFRDLVGLIDASAQLHFEGLRDRWGMFADVAYVSLSDTQTGDRELLRFDFELKETVAEVGAIYRPGGRDGAFDLLVGGRLLSFDETYRFSLGAIGSREASVDEDFLDALVALRYAIRLSDRWVITLRGDASFGGTDGIWTGQALLGWRFGKYRNSAVFLGYRYRDMKYGKAEVLDVHKTLSGVGFGVRLGF